MIHIGTIQVHIKVKGDSGFERIDIAQLAPAAPHDMLSAGWKFAWDELSGKTDFECQGIAKLEYAGNIFGLVRYGLYPYPGEPQFLEIEHLEANPPSVDYINGIAVKRERLVDPVGSWLIWYATKVALHFLKSDNPKFVVVEPLHSAFDFYNDAVGMQHQGAITLNTGEDGHVFTMARERAREFCSEQTKKYGLS